MCVNTRIPRMREFPGNTKSPEGFLSICILQDSITPTSPSKNHIRAFIDDSHVYLVPLHQILNQVMLMCVIAIVWLVPGEFRGAITFEPGRVDEWLVCCFSFSYQDTMQPKLALLSHNGIDASGPAPLSACM